MPLQALPNEQDLLLQISENDHEAFRFIFDHYFDKIYSMALTYTKSVASAEDLVQNIFIKVWEKRVQLPKIKNFDSYLFIVSRNAIISSLRRKIVLVPFDSQEEWPDSAITPDEIYDAKESGDLIAEAVEQLPPQQKKVYQLSRIAGLSTDAIAAEMGITVSTVKGHLTKALLQVRKKLSESGSRPQVLWWLILEAILKK